jgi:hypothetical protein
MLNVGVLLARLALPVVSVDAKARAIDWAEPQLPTSRLSLRDDEVCGCVCVFAVVVVVVVVVFCFALY